MPSRGHLPGGWLLGAIPFVVIIVSWYAAPRLIDYPPYVLPAIGRVWEHFIGSARDGSLLITIAKSLLRLFLGFIIGNVIAIPLGVAIGMNRAVSDALRPVLSFFQSIAGVAWVPLAIIWFAIGT